MIRWMVVALGAGMAVSPCVLADETETARFDAAGPAARLLAASCANCHGTDGHASDGMSALAGYPRDRLIAAMQAFRTEQRPATVMHQLARGFSDEQVATLAEHFARQPVAPQSVAPPPAATQPVAPPPAAR